MELTDILKSNQPLLIKAELLQTVSQPMESLMSAMKTLSDMLLQQMNESQRNRKVLKKRSAKVKLNEIIERKTQVYIFFK